MMRKINITCICLVFVFYFIEFQAYYHTRTINSQPVISINELLKFRKDIKYIKVSNSFELHYEKNPLMDHQSRIWWERDPVVHPEMFLLSVPCGRVYSQDALIIVDNMYVDEFVWGPTKHGCFFPLIDISRLGTPTHIHAKVAVIDQSGSGNYYHWMVEVLPKLALLQRSNIDYDYLYLPCDRRFMKDTIDLLGVDRSKIITKYDKNNYIEADELIVPSVVSAFGYSSPFVIQFLRESFIPLAEKSIDFNDFSRRVFISRKKATSRKITNEDEIFTLFEEHGFVRYNLEDLSILQQVALFFNAEIIVGEHGAGLTNIVFSKPGTKVIEIFQARERAMYWYLSQELGLDHLCVKTIEFDVKKNGNFHSVIPLDKIKNLVTIFLNK